MKKARRRCLLQVVVLVIALGLVSTTGCAINSSAPPAPTATSVAALVFPPTFTPTFTPTALPTITPGPTLPPFVFPEVRLEVLSYNAFRTPAEVYVAGAAINRGTLAAGEVRVAVSLIDARGNVASTGSLNQSNIWYVPPNGKFPFLVPMPTAPKEWKDVKIQFETKP